MVAVGDTNQVFVYNISNQGQYELIQTLNTVKDAGFSCAWDHSSTKFAVGCQDGFVCLWDVRRSKQLTQLTSQQTNGRGAVRSVKFSQSSSLDLLAFTEHTSFVNVFDARTFETRDILRIGTPTAELNLTGLTFSSDSRSIFVGTEQTILEYDVNTRNRRIFPTGQII
jgi:WD40 repeat protein